MRNSDQTNPSSMRNLDHNPDLDEETKFFSSFSFLKEMTNIHHITSINE